MKRSLGLLVFAAVSPFFFQAGRLYSDGKGVQCKVCGISSSEWSVVKIHGRKNGKDVWVEPRYTNQGGFVGQLQGGGCTYCNCRWTGQIQAKATGDYEGTVRIEIWLENVLKKEGSVPSGGTLAWDVTGSGSDKIESACSESGSTMKKVKVVLITDEGGSSEMTFTCNKATSTPFGPEEEKKKKKG